MTELVWILSSCVLILAVAGIQAVFGKRMRPGLRYALWGLVLLRLLIPVQLFTVPWSVASTVQDARQTTLGEAAAYAVTEYRLPRMTYSQAVDRVTAEYEAAGVDLSTLDNSELDSQAYRHMQSSVTLSAVLRWVWLGGAGVTALAFAALNLRFSLRLRARRKRLDADCPLPVYAVEGLSSSCLFWNTVYVSAETAEDGERLRHVLAHELSHRRHGDHLWALLRCAALAIHWYNPLVWWAAALSRQASELCADAGALKRLGEEERERYGATLIELSAGRVQKAPLLCAATTMTNGKRSLKERVTMIARRPKMTALILTAVLLIAALAVGCAFAGAKKQQSAPMTEEEALDALEASVESWTDENGVRYVAFTMPDYDRMEDFGLHIAGRAVAEDGMSMSMHYFEDETWKAGKRYVIELTDLTELTLSAALAGRTGGLWSREIDLLAAVLPDVLPPGLDWGISLYEAAERLGLGDLRSVTGENGDLYGSITALNERIREQGYSLTGGFHYLMLSRDDKAGRTSCYFTPDGEKLYEAAVSYDFRDDTAAKERYDGLLGSLTEKYGGLSYVLESELPYRFTVGDEYLACGLAFGPGRGTYEAVVLDKKNQPAVTVYASARGRMLQSELTDASGLCTAPGLAWLASPEALGVAADSGNSDLYTFAGPVDAMLLGYPAQALLTFFHNELTEVSYTYDPAVDPAALLSRLTELCGRCDLDHDFGSMDAYVWRSVYFGTRVSSTVTLNPADADGRPCVAFTLRSAAPFLEPQENHTSAVAPAAPDTALLQLGGENKIAAHRVDGDGWYFYLPDEGWTRENDGAAARWVAASETGSVLQIREASREELQAERPGLTEGQTERFVETAEGRIWRVWTWCDPRLAIYSDRRGLEASILQAMARSFTVIFPAANNTGAAAQDQWTPLAALPGDYSLEQAKADGCIVLEDGQATAGRERFSAFLEHSEAGQPDTVRVVKYYTLSDPAHYDPEYYEEIRDDYPMLFANDLSCDGTSYTWQFYEEGELYEKQYRHLLRFAEETETADGSWAVTVRYVLANDPDVTWEDIWRGMLSSRFGDGIDHQVVYQETFRSGMRGAKLTAADLVTAEGRFVFPYMPPDTTRENFAGYTGLTPEQSYEEFLQFMPKELAKMEHYRMVEGNENLSFFSLDGKAALAIPAWGPQGNLRQVIIAFADGADSEAERLAFTDTLLRDLRRATGKSEEIMFINVGSGALWIEYDQTADGRYMAKNLVINYEYEPRTGSAPTPAPEPEPLNDAALALWAEELSPFSVIEPGMTGPSMVSCFFTSLYSDPRDLDLAEFLRYCPLAEAVTDEAEFDALDHGWTVGRDGHRATLAELPVPVWRYRVSAINEALTKYAGITLDDMRTDWRKDSRMLYSPEQDAFYNFTSDFGPGTFVPTAGEQTGDILTLRSASTVLTLRLTAGGWQILSYLVKAE